MLDWVLVGWFVANTSAGATVAALTGSDYAVLIPLIFTSAAQAIVMVIHALQQRDLKRQLNLPSQERTLGEAVEGIQVASSAAATDSARVRRAVLPNAPPPVPPIEPAP